MAISEKITLLGAGLYKDIPDVLTLKSIPTASELDYVGREDFQATMLDTILPKAVEEDIDFRKLLEIDFHWVCRCLRILNYGPYYTTNTIYCSGCSNVSSGEYQVDLRTIEVKPLPAGFINSLVISKDEFIDFDGDVVLKLPTIQEMMNAEKDPLFKNSKGETNMSLARMCYMVKSIKTNSTLSIPETKMSIISKMTSADFLILKAKAGELADYGLRAGGTTVCPKCGAKDAAFVALVDDRFFRPTMGDLRAWKADRDVERTNKSAAGITESGKRVENIPSNAPTKV